ncbi:hypothetical protein DFH07DRAFT_195672 [Mycena maculata]|uniref:Uncharacterized protein n=1 Tax=Mycena maculata TaxID=230809 RepID=A0AAD7KDZ9_9AGAR|nr:hypothetical protein DFH07DRAFT_195672 [Mycena maculata]
MVSPKSFVKPHQADGWFCNICNPSSFNGDQAAHMNIHAALRHERESAQHARNVQESEMWWNPSSHDPAVWNAPLDEEPLLTKEEVQMREHQDHVERVSELVPYWIKCVDAAAKGEELRLEPFLNTLKDVSHSWSRIHVDNPWAMGSGAWGNGGDADRWGVHPDAKSMSSSAHGSKMNTGTRTISSSGSVVENPQNAYAFVEDIARQQAADAERKRRMHKFFQMPTHEKVKKIDEIVRYLQSASV